MGLLRSITLMLLVNTFHFSTTSASIFLNEGILHVTVEEGESVSLTCEVSCTSHSSPGSTDPKREVRWFYGASDKELGGSETMLDSRISIQAEKVSEWFVVANLTIRNVSMDHAGNYTCCKRFSSSSCSTWKTRSEHQLQLVVEAARDGKDEVTHNPCGINNLCVNGICAQTNSIIGFKCKCITGYGGTFCNQTADTNRSSTMLPSRASTTLYNASLIKSVTLSSANSSSRQDAGLYLCFILWAGIALIC